MVKRPVDREALDVRLLRWWNERGKRTHIWVLLWRWRASAEDRADLKQENRKMNHALSEIVNVLGPENIDCDENGCAGCKWEMAEALDLAKNGLQ